ncbi:MAG: hypothetical protein QOC57_2013 [Ilumatobacteraceae bacterium]
MHTATIIDPIDQLIPPPRPWWVRLAIGLAIVAVVGFGSALWRAGYVYPKPECCGSGSGGTRMSLTDDGTAVMITKMFYNSSGRRLKISAASAELPGASVLGLAILEEPDPYPIIRTAPLPAEVDGAAYRSLAITFVPTSCHDQQPPWGKVTVKLDVIHEIWPSVSRTYTVPGAVFETSNGAMSVTPTEGIDTTTLTTPLAVACALLGRTGG